MPAYPHPSLFNHLFANYHQAFYPHMMMPQKPPGGCYGHPCCGGFHAAAMHQMMHDMHHSCCQQKKQKKVEQSSSSDESESSEKGNSDLRVTKMNSAFKAFTAQQKVTVNKFEAPASSSNS